MSTLVDQARKVIAALDFVFRDGNVEAVQSAQELIRKLADRVQEPESTIQDSLKVADPVQPEKEERRPLSEQQLVRCLVESGCLGTVRMSYDSGPYEITRTSINADRFARAIESAHGIGISPSTSMVGKEGDGK